MTMAATTRPPWVPILTGVHPRKSVTCGVSVDQLAAQHYGHQTRLSSLEIATPRAGEALRQVSLHCHRHTFMADTDAASACGNVAASYFQSPIRR